MNNKIAVFPGTFDPFTIGHRSIVERALPLFDRLIIAIGNNTAKHSQQTAQERLQYISTIFDSPKIDVQIYDTLTVDFAKKVHAKYIVRGLRSTADFKYEQEIAEANKILTGIETILFLADSDKKEISSSLIREMKKFGKDISDYMPCK